jgi:hypothetical protein
MWNSIIRLKLQGPWSDYNETAPVTKLKYMIRQFQKLNINKNRLMRTLQIYEPGLAGKSCSTAALG